MQQLKESNAPFRFYQLQEISRYLDLADKFESEPEEKGAIVDRDLIKQTFANFFRNPQLLKCL